MAKEGRDLQLTMAHADTPTLLRHQAENNQAAQVAIYLHLAGRLKRCGIERIAVTSIAGHFCIEAFKEVSPVPVIDLLETVRAEVQFRALKKVGLLGTRVVMESRFYGVLEDVQVIPPNDEHLLEVHNAYVAMASSGIATEQHREVFLRAGKSLVNEYGCESILLAGTDLALVFNKKFDPGFPILDCAEVHAAAIAQCASFPETLSDPEQVHRAGN
jgi:aspartate racemase